MAPKTNALETLRRETLSPKRIEQMMRLVPDVARKYLTPDRIVRLVCTSVSRNPLLMQCTQTSILVATMDSASMGLEPNGPLGHTYFVPFRNNKINAYEATCIVGYKGMLELARRSGQLASVRASEVYAEDEFMIDLGEMTIKHRPALSGRADPADIVGAYCVAYFVNGEKHLEWLTRGQIEQHRAISKARDSGPWRDWYGMMARKTAIRVACRYFPTVIELAEAMQREDDREAGIIDGGMLDEIAEASQAQVESRKDQVRAKLAGKQEPTPVAQPEPELDAEQQALLAEYEAEAQGGQQ